MDSMPLTTEEKKSREVKSRAVLARNARILTACGFVGFTNSTVRGLPELWLHSKFTMPPIAINQHEFGSLVDLVCIVHRCGIDAGESRVRRELKKVLHIL